VRHVEGAEFHEGAGVGEPRDALAGVEPSLGAASGETLRPAHAPGALAPRLEILHPIVPAHEGSATLSRGRRHVKDGPAPRLRSTPWHPTIAKHAALAQPPGEAAYPARGAPDRDLVCRLLLEKKNKHSFATPRTCRST